MQQNVQVCTYLRGWTHDLRVIAGDTSSYLRGDDTSKLVTPSEACWAETNESHKQRTETVWSEEDFSVCHYSSYNVQGWRRSVESMEWDAVVHCDITQARPPACNAQLNYPTWLEEHKTPRNYSTIMSLSHISMYCNMEWPKRTTGKNWPLSTTQRILYHYLHPPSHIY